MSTVFSPAYKITLSPPGDTDPPSAPIWTVDNVIGINPPLINTHQLPDPYDFGACGDGVTDDTVAFQAWLDAIAGGAGYGARGTFAVSSTVKISGATTIYGAGKSAFTLATLPGFPSTQELMTNKNVEGSPNPIVDVNIQVYGMGFLGSSSELSAVELVSYAGVYGATFRDCLFQHHRNTLLNLTNCQNGLIDANEFYDGGVLARTASGGPAIRSDQTNSDTRITKNYVHNCEWSGIEANGGRDIITDNTILSVKDYGISSGPGPFGVTIKGNFIGLVSYKFSTADGISLLAPNSFTVTGNVIGSCDNRNIFLQDPQFGTVTGNVCTSAGANPAQFPAAASIQINGAISGVSAVSVNDNMCDCGSAPADSGIRLSNTGWPTAPPYSAFMCSNNNLNGGFKTAAMIVDSNVNDPANPPTTEIIVRGNLGTPNEDRSAVSFVIPSGSSGTMLVIGVGFKPRSIDFQASISSTSLQATSMGQAMWQTFVDVSTVPPSIINPRANFVDSAISWSNDGTNSASVGAFDIASIAIFGSDGDPTTAICRAFVSGIVDDGFILTFNPSPTTMDVFVTAVCYP